MRILIICSKAFYDRIPAVKGELEDSGHIVALPNCFDDPATEERYKSLGTKEHSQWKASMFEQSVRVIEESEAVLVLNHEKKGVAGYIGGATFLEMYDAFRLGKKIFLWNNIPEGILTDEIRGFAPMVIEGDIARII